MILGPRQLIFSGDATAATHRIGNTGDAGLTNIVANKPVLSTFGAWAIIMRVWCTGPGAGGTLVLDGNQFVSFSGIAGAATAVFPGAGAGGNDAMFEKPIEFVPPAAFLLAPFDTEAHAGLMAIRPKYNATLAPPAFMSPNMFVGITVGLNDVTGLNIEARCAYWATIEKSAPLINQFQPATPITWGVGPST